MTSQHTPGPWIAKSSLSYTNSCGIHDSHGNLIAATFVGDKHGIAESDIGAEEAIKNARLIAAAPDLLAALQAFLFDFGDFDGDEERLAEFRRIRKEIARPAIAKATAP